MFIYCIEGDILGHFYEAQNLLISVLAQMPVQIRFLYYVQEGEGVTIDASDSPVWRLAFLDDSEGDLKLRWSVECDSLAEFVSRIEHMQVEWETFYQPHEPLYANKLLLKLVTAVVVLRCHLIGVEGQDTERLLFSVGISHCPPEPDQPARGEDGSSGSDDS